MGSDIILAAESGGSGAFNLLLLLAVPLVFYFLLIRPQSRRRKQQMEMQNAMEPGARVLTTSGMRATVVEVDDDGIVLEIADGVEVRFVKAAVMQVLKDDEPEDLDDEQDEPAEADGDEDGDRVDLSKDDDVEDAEAGGADEADEAEESKPKGRAKVKASDKPSA
ncbi:preprotein translocase subunit YajC [Actinomadura sp. KC06]|uniref:preprotein translocase subunit YajC n=1 Tax=Actinomadura sp. KC06 TaxID=2530369 RepID=UPI0010516F27|nr:preprotein translocase subunit YajC [Actinomadura sp. KC06]TDD38898.1 preprotein translocase subunit YajC [Actinomadura sp. KC06]